MFDAEDDKTPASQAKEREDDALHCARCGHLVTRTRWAFAPDGAAERLCANPAGLLFKVVCFTEAPGAADQGPPTEEFSWFKGYAWNFAVCRGCSEHLGWRYTGEAQPSLFWGFIKDRLTSQPK